MDRSAQKINLLILIALVTAGAACLWAAGRTYSLAGQVAAWFFLVAFLVTLISWFQQRLVDREQIEQLEFDELARSKGATSLFDRGDSENFPARQSRKQFEKWFIPIGSSLLIVFQGWLVWHLWRKLSGGPKFLEDTEIGMAVYATALLGLMILGLYASGLARHGKHPYLRPGAAYVLLNAYLCGVVAVGLLGARIGDADHLDLYVARGLVILLGLVTLEMGITLVFEGYRPRVKGREKHLLYESRVIGLLSRPDSFVTTAAQALDYQFGFNVSETWFYQFLRRSIAWIVLVQVGLFWVSTTVVLIEPGEQGLRERFGSARGDVLEPGIHFKLPWPMAKIITERTSQVQSFVIGTAPDDDGIDLSANDRLIDVVQWSVSHADEEEFNVLVASATQGSESGATESVPVSLLTVSIPVHFAINDLKAWVYNNADPAQLLEDIAQREVVRYLANVELLEVMGAGRSAAIAEMKERMQLAADSVGLGAQILFVGLQDSHPPTEVASSFHDVLIAMQNKESAVLEAETYRAGTVPLAAAEATNLVILADMYRIQTTNSAAAEAARFGQQLMAYREAPEIYAERMRLETLARSVTNARVYVIGVTNTDQIINFNMEEKIRADLRELGRGGN